MSNYKRGLKLGIPIALGYLSVSFTFGIMAVKGGLFWWQAVLVSMLNVTSAGQLAGIGIMVLPGQYLSMFISQLTINMRYSFMSVTISQKVSPRFNRIKRWILGFFMTDEIFAVSNLEDEVEPIFFTGLATLPFIGWTFGTFLGAVLGSVLPGKLLSALSLGLYAMFVAIVVPEMKKGAHMIFVVVISIILSCSFQYVPFLKAVPGGIAISVVAIVSAIIASIVFPVDSKGVRRNG